MTKEERKEYQKAWREKNKERLKEKRKAYRDANREQKKEQNKRYREKNKEKIKAWREKNKEKAKAYREANRDKIKAYEYDNKERLREYQKAYYKTNKEEINEKKKAYSKERRKKDPLFKLKGRLRCASYKAFKGQRKPKKTEELLGCTYNDFKDYITAQFVGNMTWENYGDVWHVDHIIPLATIKDVSQIDLISSLCHYSNLQPLFADDNHSKNDRLDYEYPAIYKTNLLHNSNKK
jgi:hypothetical protein